MSPLYETYLSEVRAVLQHEPVTWQEDQTEALLALHVQQGTGALVFPSVLTIPSVSSYARAQMRSVCVRTIQNQVPLQYTLETAWRALEKAGIHAVLMKGAGLAALYPEPHYRSWGDIDLYVGPDQYHPACAVMRETFPNALKFDEELDHYKHYNLIADGISIEVHRVTVSLQHPRDERLYARMEREGMTRTRALDVNGLEVMVPEPTFNALFVFLHSWEHMLSAGANIRQLCDLALLLRHYADCIDAPRLRRYLEDLHLMDVWRLYACILVQSLGFSADEVPFYSPHTVVRAQKLLEDLLAGRMNEPKRDAKAPKGRIERKWFTMKIRFATARRISRYSPSYARHMNITTLLHGIRRFFAKDRKWE